MFIMWHATYVDGSFISGRSDHKSALWWKLFLLTCTGDTLLCRMCTEHPDVSAESPCACWESNPSQLLYWYSSCSEINKILCSCNYNHWRYRTYKFITVVYNLHTRERVLQHLSSTRNYAGTWPLEILVLYIMLTTCNKPNSCSHYSFSEWLISQVTISCTIIQPSNCQHIRHIQCGWTCRIYT